MDSSFPHGYALIIGVDANQLAELVLPAVANDVTAVYDVLTDPQFCGYLPGHVKLLSGEQATSGNIMQALTWLQEKVRADPQATAVLYYGGHGLRDRASGQYYLIPYDVQSLRMLRTYAIRAEILTAVIDAIQASRLLLLLDCNHAQSLDFDEYSILAAEAFPANLSEIDAVPAYEPGSDKAAKLPDGAGKAILISSMEFGSSYVRDDQRIGIFANHLIEALTGGAHYGEGDSEIHASAVLDWVGRRVQGTAESMSLSQTPVSRASGDFPVALLLGGQGAASVASERAPTTLAAPPESPSITVEGFAGVTRDEGLEFYEAEPEIAFAEFAPGPVDLSDGGTIERSRDAEESDTGDLFELLEKSADGIEDQPETRELFRPDEDAEAESVPSGQSTKGLGELEPVETTRQNRRFEAAMPNTIQAGVTTEILVMIPLASGPGLSEYLPLETTAGDVIDIEDVERQEVELEFTEPGKPLLAYIHIQASKRDFEIEESFRAILVYPDRDGDYESFLLTPLRATSRAPVTVKLYADKERTFSLSTIRLSVAIESDDEVSQRFLARNDLDRTVGYAAATGNVTINVVGGDQISATISDSSGVALGRDAQASVRTQTTSPSSDLSSFFMPLTIFVVQEAPRGLQVQAISLVQSLQSEVGQAMGADDAKVAGLIQDLADMVPAAVETIVSLFSSPPLSVKTGGTTKFVLGRIGRPS